MAAEGPYASAGQPPAPPTEPGPIPSEPRRSSWPTVIGILAIVWGGLGIFGAACGAMGTLFADLVPRPPGAATLPAVQPMGPMPLLSTAGSISLAILLLASGIGLLRRRRWSARALRIWAVLGLLLAVLTVSLTHGAMREALQSAQAQRGVAMPRALEGALIGFGFVWTLVLSVAPPVFVLWWFSRGRVKQEIATWA